MSHLYTTCIPPVSYRILGIPLYSCICIYLHLTILQQIHCSIPLYISLYPAVPIRISCICIQLYPALYLTVSHRLENGIWPKIHSRGGPPAPSEFLGLYKIFVYYLYNLCARVHHP